MRELYGGRLGLTLSLQSYLGWSLMAKNLALAQLLEKIEWYFELSVDRHFIIKINLFKE